MRHCVSLPLGVAILSWRLSKQEQLESANRVKDGFSRSPPSGGRIYSRGWLRLWRTARVWRTARGEWLPAAVCMEASARAARGSASTGKPTTERRRLDGFIGGCAAIGTVRAVRNTPELLCRLLFAGSKRRLSS